MKASEFIVSKNAGYGKYDNETGKRVINALTKSMKAFKNEKEKEFICDSELENIRQYNENTQRERILKAYPHAFLKGSAKWEYLDAKYDTLDRKRNEELAVNDLVGTQLKNMARIEIQKRVAERLNRIKQKEERKSANKTINKLKNNRKKKVRLEIFPQA